MLNPTSAEPYALLVVVLLIALSLAVGLVASLMNKKSASALALFFIWTVSLAVLGLREFTASADYSNYALMYQRAEKIGDVLRIYHGDHVFSSMMLAGNLVGLSINEFFFAFSVLLMGLIAYGYHLLSPRYAPLALALFLATPTFIFLNINILRQGLAVALSLVAIGWLLKSNVFKSAPFYLFSYFSHSKSALIVIGMTVFILMARRFRIFSRRSVPVTLVFIVSVAVILIEALVGSGASSKLNAYLGKEAGGVSGVFLYAKIFILIFPLFIYACFSIRLKVHLSETVLLLYLMLICVAVTLVPHSAMAANRVIYSAAIFSPLIVASLASIKADMLSKAILFLSLLAGGLSYSLLTYSFPSVRRQMGFNILSSLWTSW